MLSGNELGLHSTLPQRNFVGPAGAKYCHRESSPPDLLERLGALEPSPSHAASSKHVNSDKNIRPARVVIQCTYRVGQIVERNRSILLGVFVSAFPRVVEEDSITEIKERFVQRVELILPVQVSLENKKNYI